MQYKRAVRIVAPISPGGTSDVCPDECDAFISCEPAKWTKVAGEAGAKVD